MDTVGAIESVSINEVSVKLKQVPVKQDSTVRVVHQKLTTLI